MSDLLLYTNQNDVLNKEVNNQVGGGDENYTDEEINILNKEINKPNFIF